MNSKELAKIAGVSQSTVSRALNNSPLISKEKREAIQQLALKYNFEFNSQARSLKTNRTGTIGILFPAYFQNLSNNLYFTFVYDTLQKELRKYDFDLMLIYDEPDKNENSPLLRMIAKRKIDGYIFVWPDISEREADVLSQEHIPFVSIFGEPSIETDMPSFVMDSYDCGYLAGKQLYRPNTKIFYLGVDRESSYRRRDGYCDALREAGMEGDVTEIVTDMSVKAAYEAIRENAALFREKASIYVYNDMMAVGVCRALRDSGIDIPGQVQVMGTDNIPMTEWFPEELSTIWTPTQPIIAAACAKLFQLINYYSAQAKSACRCFKPKLLLRKTTENGG